MRPALTFSSGMSRRGDFRPALAADHSIGIDIQEMSSAAIADLAQAFASSRAHLFIDSGAFSHFRATVVRGKDRKPIDFARVFDKYDELARAVCNATDDGGNEAGERLHFVMPDIVGDQAATIALWRSFDEDVKSFVRHANAILPMQGGELTLSELYAAASEILGAGLPIGIPSAEKAVDNDELARLCAAYGDEIHSVHILGAADEKKIGPRLDAIARGGYDGPITADANRLRSLWKPYKGVDRKAAMAQLLALDHEPEPTPPAPAVCAFCGEIEELDIAEIWGHEFTLTACCEVVYDDAIEILGRHDESSRALLKHLGVEEYTGRELRRAGDNEGQIILDYNLDVREISRDEARAFVNEHHTHNKAPVGWRYGAGIWNGPTLIGVCMVGRPVARMIDASQVVEVNRVCVRRDVPDPLRWNACSQLYGWAAREAKRRGFARIITYTLQSEPATTLRAAGWVQVAKTRGGSWNRPGRARTDQAPIEPKYRWERQLRRAA